MIWVVREGERGGGREKREDKSGSISFLRFRREGTKAKGQFQIRFLLWGKTKGGLAVSPIYNETEDFPGSARSMALGAKK